MEQDPSPYTAGMDTVFATVCPGGSSDLGTGIWSRDHHRALQVWIRCLLLCVLEVATARCGDMEPGPSSCTVGMVTVFDVVCLGEGPVVDTGKWSRSHHRALQIEILCWRLCILEEEQFFKVWLVITNFHVTCHPAPRPTSTYW